MSFSLSLSFFWDESNLNEDKKKWENKGTRERESITNWGYLGHGKEHFTVTGCFVVGLNIWSEAENTKKEKERKKEEEEEEKEEEGNYRMRRI